MLKCPQVVLSVPREAQGEPGSTWELRAVCGILSYFHILILIPLCGIPVETLMGSVGSAPVLVPVTAGALHLCCAALQG